MTETSPRVQRRLAAILAADVVGYSALMSQNEEGALAQIKALQQDLLEPALRRHQGRLVKTTGDGFLVEFSSPVEAVRCALMIQNALAGGPLQLRIGINLGDVIIDPDGDIYGEGVNVAARLEALCDPGGVLVSGKVYDEAEGKVEAAFESRGEQTVKNIPKPVRAYALSLASPPPSNRPKPLPLPDRPSIAVLPFTNMSGDPEQEYFADGVVEDIITALSRVRWFFVIARNSSFTYKGKAVDIRQVGRELGVRYVLEGSIRKAGSRVRITGQLIEAATGHHVWADKFDGSLEDIFDLQDQITESIVGAIEPNLRLAEITRAKSKPTESLDAYDLCLRAMNLHSLSNEVDMRAALRLLHQAMDLDPAYALPKGMAAFCYGRMHHERWHEPQARERALELAKAAVTYGQEDPTALRLAGHMLGYVGREYEAALAAVDRALALNPNLAAAYGSSGWVRIYVGDYATAVQHFQRAMRLSPLDPDSYMMLSGMAAARFQQGGYEEALEWAVRCIREHPMWSTAHRTHIAILVHLDRIEEAREAARHYMARFPAYRVSDHLRDSPIRSQTTKQQLADALLRAGVPE